MSPRKTQSTTTNDQVSYERCLCRELVETVREFVGISPAVKQHLSNSRVEFLKAIRQVIDERIDHLSGQGQRGTKVAVE
ncbi:MAG TPA: hypothetical protein VKB58_10830 [Terriglobales bacterium]|jgi:hypothetical protein|nr:hypothetical protein [Terriglobales bacterium]